MSYQHFDRINTVRRSTIPYLYSEVRGTWSDSVIRKREDFEYPVIMRRGDGIGTNADGAIEGTGDYSVIRELAEGVDVAGMPVGYCRGVRWVKRIEDRDGLIVWTGGYGVVVEKKKGIYDVSMEMNCRNRLNV